MGQLRAGHLVEAGLWLSLCLFLYIYSFEFDREIEIYKFGASAWPRAIILLMAIAAIGQLIHHWKRGDQSSSQIIDAATDDGAEEAAHEAHHESLKWYASTFALLVIPFAYLRVPGWIAAAIAVEGPALHVIRVICAALLENGLTIEEAEQKCWFFDSTGLVVASRSHLADHKLRYAHAAEFTDDFETAIRDLRPSVLIGVSGTPRTFSEPVLKLMARLNERPVILALSNPTSKAECTARQAYEWTEGRCVFASGSPFDSVDLDGRVFVPGQANNAYIFPGVGLGAIASEASIITDEMFFVAAKALAKEVSDADLALGRLYPSLTRIRSVSARIATA